MKRIDRRLALGLGAAAWAAVFLCGATVRVLADCASYGLPFTDLGAETAFCSAIAEAYYTGITSGTSATTFEPAANLTREQAAAFATRTLDAGLTRGSRRGALGQWWTTTPHYDTGLGTISIGAKGQFLQSDGSDIWIPAGDKVIRIRASDGAVLGSWTGATSAKAVLVAMNRVFVTDSQPSGVLLMFDPSTAPGPMEAVATLGKFPTSITFDGNRIWTANSDVEQSSVSIIDPRTWSVLNVGVSPTLGGVVFDGRNVWVTSLGDIFKLNTDGSISMTVHLSDEGDALFPTFDGTNIWIPIGSYPGSLVVLRASDGRIIKTFSEASGNANGLREPHQAAFDGQRIMVTNWAGDSVSLFRASDLSIIGNYSTGLGESSLVNGVCSDGASFWISFSGVSVIARF